MDVTLLYGREGLTFALPPGARPTLITKSKMPVLPDPAAAIEEALDGSGSAPALKRRAAGQDSACILICDVTRPVPNQLFLRPMIERLLAAGIPADAITVLVATGLHRPNLGAELAEVVGDPWVLSTVDVVNHDAHAPDEHEEVGTTSRGAIVRLDRRFVEADIRIATGLVEPHLMAGYSGGRKVITPGIAEAETIRALHSHRYLGDEAATNCRLEGNPLHEDLLEVIDMVGGALALNTVIDEERRLAFVNYGEIVASHLEAVDFVRAYAEVKVGRRFKTVVTSAAGYPLDRTWYQAIKGLVGPLDILEEGGDLIIAAECGEGLGSEAFLDAQRRLLELGRQGFLETLAAKPTAAIDEWQSQMQTRSGALARVTLYSVPLDADARRLTGATVTDDLEAAVAESLTRHGDPELAIIPEGPYVVPFGPAAEGTS